LVLVYSFFITVFGFFRFAKSVVIWYAPRFVNVSCVCGFSSVVSISVSMSSLSGVHPLIVYFVFFPCLLFSVVSLVFVIRQSAYVLYALASMYAVWFSMFVIVVISFIVGAAMYLPISRFIFMLCLFSSFVRFVISWLIVSIVGVVWLFCGVGIPGDMVISCMLYPVFFICVVNIMNFVRSS